MLRGAGMVGEGLAWCRFGPQAFRVKSRSGLLWRGLDEASPCKINAHSHLLFMAVWIEITVVIFPELRKDAQSHCLSAQEGFTSSC